MKKARKHAKAAAEGALEVQSVFDDERLRKQEMAMEREKKKIADTHREMLLMNSDKMNDMREQNLLRAKMQMAYRTGDQKEVARIQAILNPEEDEEKLKYLHKNKEASYLERRNNQQYRQ